MCNYDEALPFLKEVALSQRLAAPFAYTALGDVIVRLGRESDQDASPIFWCIDLGSDALTDGAFRAMAMLRMVPDGDAIGRIISFVKQRDSWDMLRFWPAVAAAGWSGEIVHDFLVECSEAVRSDIVEAANASLAGEYRDYQIL